MVGALLAALRFVRRRPAAVVGLWLMNAALAAATLAAWTLAAPGPGAVIPAMRSAFLGGQLCIAAQLFAQLVAWASQTAYFQDQLAHATYVARGARVTARTYCRSARLTARRRLSATVRTTFTRANRLSSPSTSTHGARRVLVRLTISSTAST